MDCFRASHALRDSWCCIFLRAFSSFTFRRQAGTFFIVLDFLAGAIAALDGVCSSSSSAYFTSCTTTTSSDVALAPDQTPSSLRSGRSLEVTPGRLLTRASADTVFTVATSRTFAFLSVVISFAFFALSDVRLFFADFPVFFLSLVLTAGANVSRDSRAFFIPVAIALAAVVFASCIWPKTSRQADEKSSCRLAAMSEEEACSVTVTASLVGSVRTASCFAGVRMVTKSAKRERITSTSLSSIGPSSTPIMDSLSSSSGLGV
mmetsp:Transcript_23187/g.60642  ORF Transcript_23187/g.60642 Transcript_23187/m.60642 type:complete len:262 (-) Transcript_23187:1272-2057(-)